MPPKKRNYPYNDKIQFEVIEEGNIHLRVISNEKGMFVDIRRFYSESGNPSPKGLRMPIDVFERIYKAYIKSDFDKMENKDIKEDDALKLKPDDDNGSKKIKK